MFACLTTHVLSGTKLGLCRSVPMNLQGQLLKPGFEVPLAAQGLCLKDTALSWAHLQKRVCSGNTYSLVGRLGLEKISWADRHNFNFGPQNPVDDTQKVLRVLQDIASKQVVSHLRKPLIWQTT